jgi:hypothetical protein
MFGTFTEEALERYEALVQQDYKEKRVRGGQGTEYADNLGVGETDESFIDADESQNIDDYSEHYDFTTCIRSDGTLYGIGGGKCRKGTEVSASAVARLKQERKTPKQKQREAIQKRGVKAVTKAKAEKVLGDLQKAGATEKKATERRAEKGKGGDREEQVRQVRAKAFLTMDRLRQKAKKMVPGQKKQQVEARIARLQAVLGRLDKTQKELREAKPKQQGEGFGRIPAAYESGRGLA